MTYGDNVLDFSYDINGVPVAMRHGYASHNNYVVYYYITNLQGDVVRLVDIYGNTAVYYEYDALEDILLYRDLPKSTKQPWLGQQEGV